MDIWILLFISRTTDMILSSFLSFSTDRLTIYSEGELNAVNHH